MSRSGRIIQVVDPSTNTNLSGLWGLNEILGYINQTKWPRGPTASATPSPTASATPSPTASATPEPTPTPTATPTPTHVPAIQGLSVVSGSTSGDGTSASPYLVASDTSPSPVYETNFPGLLTVNFTNIRTGDYNCGKEGCSTGRFNEGVYFRFSDGNFYEQIRTNIDNFTTNTGFGYNAFLTSASRNTLTSISYPMHKGQRLRMSQHSSLSGDDRSAPDNNRQLTNTRISFTPSDSNFSISSIGSRSLFGNGTASMPYCAQTNFSSGRDQRTMVFRANGNGVVAVYGIRQGVVPLSNYDNSPILRTGGSSNNFTGSVEKTKLDFFQFTTNPYNTMVRPSIVTTGFFWVNNGEIFSFAKKECDKGGCWIQEIGTDINFGPIMVWAVPQQSDNGLFLMNYAVPATWRWHGGQSPTTLWSGLGTPYSPASMDNWSSNIYFVGQGSTIYTSLNGVISFNYQIETNGNDLFVAQWRTLGFGNSAHLLSDTNISNGSSSGTASINVLAFRGITFRSSIANSRFRITNLVLTPS